MHNFTILQDPFVTTLLAPAPGSSSLDGTAKTPGNPTKDVEKTVEIIFMWSRAVKPLDSDTIRNTMKTMDCYI